LTEAASTPRRVCLLDVGDNVGGGSPGDGALLARELHQRGFAGAFVCLCDAEAVAEAEAAGAGNRLTLTMGGRVDRAQGPHLVADVQVQSLYEGRFEEPEVRHGARSVYDMGKTAIAAYGEVCEHFIRVNTPGITCVDMTQLDFKHRRRPLWPFEELMAR
jgi:microcystin degradation protein MlrC